MDAADGVTAGSKRPLEAADVSKGTSTFQPANDAALDGGDAFKADVPARTEIRIRLMMHYSSGRVSSAPAKSTAAPQSETLMSYELVRHQVQRRLHVEKISTDAIHALVPDVEFRLFQLLQEADRFRRRCRRSKLLPEDINSACRMLNVDPLYFPARRLRLKNLFLFRLKSILSSMLLLFLKPRAHLRLMLRRQVRLQQQQRVACSSRLQGASRPQHQRPRARRALSRRRPRRAAASLPSRTVAARALAGGQRHTARHRREPLARLCRARVLALCLRCACCARGCSLRNSHARACHRPSRRRRL